LSRVGTSRRTLGTILLRRMSLPARLRRTSSTLHSPSHKVSLFPPNLNHIFLRNNKICYDTTESLAMRVNLFRYGWLLPLIAGGAWGLTLSILLGHWLADGRPVYPGQSNPYVAFISDIAAFALKPVFITGSCLTALTYFGTIWSANHIRYAQNGYALTEDARWRKIVSSVAVIVSFEASISLMLLAGFDTLRAHERHRILLLCTFGGLGLSAVLTGITWSDQLKLNVEFPNLRRW